MIAKVFNHQLFWKKNWKSIKSLFTFFKKFQLFCYCFDSCLPQTLLSIRTMTLRNNEKKTTEAKKKKGGPLNCFLWQVAFMQHFLTYVPHHYSKNCVLPFPPQKNEKLRLNSTLEGLFSTLFIAKCKQAILTKQNSPNSF